MNVRAEKETNIAYDALQYVSNAITALRNFDDPDRQGTAALWLSRALNRLQEELPAEKLAAGDRAKLAAAQATLEGVLESLHEHGRHRSSHSTRNVR